MKPPARHKAVGEYTAEEHARAMRAERRGETFQVETDEYRKYRADALRAAGLDDEADAAEPTSTSLDEMSPAEHLAALRRT